jgi:transposase InsO family protein
MGDSLEATLPLAALRMALTTRRPAAGLVHHSDRGSQYASGDYQAVLTAHGLVASMSRKGDCWDNAVAESFFATLELELIQDADWATRAEARRAIFEFIEVWYNRQRRHSSLGYRSPAQYEAALHARAATGVSHGSQAGNGSHTCPMRHDRRRVRISGTPKGGIMHAPH